MGINVITTRDDIMFHATSVVQSFAEHSWDAFVALNASRRSTSLACRKLSVRSVDGSTST